MDAKLVNNFEVPTWAGKPPPGLHLDVMKEVKMVQKLMIDEKKCYFFGRNKQLCDFSIDHQSCSRVHAALVWHRHLNRPFLIDLGSTHGTFIGTIRLEIKKPQQVPIDSEIHFGASTRKYVIRERPQAKQPSTGYDKEDATESLFGLPETETELDNLTEFNTAHNRRIAVMGDIPDVPANPLKRKRKASHVRFNEEEEVINPEDIDPSIGRFRNLVQTTVIPKKKARMENSGITQTDALTKKLQSYAYAGNQLYGDLSDAGSGSGLGYMDTFSMASKLGMAMPNLAPDVDMAPDVALPAKAVVQPAPATGAAAAAAATVAGFQVEAGPQPAEGPRKKKYAKEAWPGRKPAHGLLV